MAAAFSKKHLRRTCRRNQVRNSIRITRSPTFSQSSSINEGVLEAASNVLPSNSSHGQISPSSGTTNPHIRPYQKGLLGHDHTNKLTVVYAAYSGIGRNVNLDQA